MKDDKVYLAHIDDAITQILSYTAGGRDAFMKNRMIRDAVVRNLEIIGEATKNLSDEAKGRRPEIPWRRVAGLRDVLIHDYMGVDLEEVWRTVEQRLPALRTAVQQLLSG